MKKPWQSQGRKDEKRSGSSAIISDGAGKGSGNLQGFKSLANPAEIKTERAQGMPEMPLKKHERQKEVGIGEPGACRVGTTSQGTESAK